MQDTNGSTVAGGTGSDVTFTHVVQTGSKPRASSVSYNDFYKTYASMAKAKHTNQEIADKLGMNVTSLVARASTLRSQLAKAVPPIELPYPKTTRGQGGGKSNKMDENSMRAFLAALDAPAVVTESTVETEVPPNTDEIAE